MEELGHSIFAHCFRPTSDPFNLFASIFETPPDQGGIGGPFNGPVDALPGCPDSTNFLSCRPDAPGEHYFLQLLIRYRQYPEFFRQRMAEEADPTKQANLAAQYQWFKRSWFEGMEFGVGESRNASLEQPGVPLLAPLQPPIGEEVPLGVGGGVCGAGGACGAGAPLAALLTLIPARVYGLRLRRGGALRRRRWAAGQPILGEHRLGVPHPHRAIPVPKDPAPRV
jgi:hypothetical protein